MSKFNGMRLATSQLLSAFPIFSHGAVDLASGGVRVVTLTMISLGYPSFLPSHGIQSLNNHHADVLAFSRG